MEWRMGSANRRFGEAERRMSKMNWGQKGLLISSRVEQMKAIYVSKAAG